MGLVVVVEKDKGRVIFTGRTNANLGSEVQVFPKYVRERLQAAKPGTYQILNTDHSETEDEGLQALLWVIEDHWEMIRHLSAEVALLRSESGQVPPAMKGGGS